MALAAGRRSDVVDDGREETAVKRRGPRAIIGVDVGATSLAGGLVTRNGAVLAVHERATRRHGAGSALDLILDVVRALQADARQRAIDVAGVGVGLPGIVDVDKGIMIGDVYLVPELGKTAIAERIREATGLTVFIDNDVNALALAEYRWGPRRVNALAMLALGSGPGGALVINGDVVRGRSGFAGEFGHVPVMLNGPPCMCGGHGCLSLFLSAELLSHEARRLSVDQPGSKLLALAGGDPAAITSPVLFTAAAAGDPVAATLVDRACEALGAGVGMIINALNPDVVVVTGGMAAAFVPLETDVLRRVAKYTTPRVLADTTIRLAPASKQQTVRGGAALFLYELARRRRAPRRSQPRG
jgi:glucokinase